MRLGRQITGVVALVSYLLMGAMIYVTVLPGTDGHWPPDFHLTGYDAQSIAPFAEAISDKARTTYGVILSRIDRVFIVALAVWMALIGWRGGWVRYFIAGLAAIYAVIDLSENAAIYRFLFSTYWFKTSDFSRKRIQPCAAGRSKTLNPSTLVGGGSVVDIMDPAAIETAHHLTMAKFASLYLCVLVLIVHLRRTA